MNKTFETVEQKVKVALDLIDTVSTTADGWSAHNMSYLGMTVHRVNTTTQSHYKATLCYFRVIDRHTYDVLAAKLNMFIAAMALPERLLPL